MNRKKRLEVVVERDQVMVVRHLKTSATLWCADCGELSRMVSVDEAAAIARTTSRDIYRSADRGKTHFAETAEGRLLICLTSLLESF